MYIRQNTGNPFTVNCWKGFNTVLNSGAWERLPDFDENEYNEGERRNRKKQAFEAQWAQFDKSPHIEGPFHTMKEVRKYEAKKEGKESKKGLLNRIVDTVKPRKTRKLKK